MLFSSERKVGKYILLILLLLIYVITFYIPESRHPVPMQITGWEFNVTRDVKNYISPENDTSVINNKQICQTDKADILIIVCSAPEHLPHRTAIRETWAGYNVSGVKLGFLLGLSINNTIQGLIEDESQEFKDIIQENFIDSYNNLTLKSILMLKWFLINCQNTTFLMKTDDDLYVNVVNLSNLLSKVKSSSLLVGKLICKAKPILNISSKWYTPKYIYQEPYFPNYLSGSGYVMTKDVASKLYKTALVTSVVHLEDVYITGICAKKAGVRPTNHDGFNFYFRGLGCVPSLITNHRVPPTQMYQVWSQHKNCTAKRLRLSTRIIKKPSICH